jgi:hypothetical protein
MAGAHLLWPRSHRLVPARGRLRRSHPQGREARRPAGTCADQVRAGDQSQDRQDARSRGAAVAARACRRGDRMIPAGCRLLAQPEPPSMSARQPLSGAKRTRFAYFEPRRDVLVKSFSANDPGCVKTPTSAKCRKYNSQVRHRAVCAYNDSALNTRSFFKVFCARRKR